ncbi:MAG: O-antigen ligase family protein [Muribaculaceae bacterium]|nr:O-antigen ligase family protein [Muribaculaceae bacterium]
MKTQIEDFDFKDLFKTTTIAGWLLLARPVIYTIFSRRRDLSSYSAVDASAIVFILYSFIAFLVGYKIVFSKDSQFGVNIVFKSPIVWFMAYSILGIISMVWSVIPTLSGFRAFECIAMALLIIAVVQQLFETDNLKYVILWSLFYCSWDIFWSILRAAQWATNVETLLESSQMMATSFFFMALYFVPRKWYNYLIMTMSVFSMSTVAYIGMGLGCISALWTHGRAKIITTVAGFTLLIVIILIGPYSFLKNTIFFDKKDISIEETSGRNHLMDATIDCVEHYPLGLGFFAAEPYVLYAKNLGAISAHNSLFSAGMGMGIPGIIIFSLFLLAMVKASFSKYIDEDFRPIIIGCFCVVLMHCMGNPSVGTRVFGAWMPCMYIFVLISAFYVYGRDYVEIEVYEKSNQIKE